MRKHVSWRAGGSAQRVYIPADLEDLTWLVRSVPSREDIHMVGLGSNLLVRDGGVKGVVILLHGVLKRLAIESRTHGLPPAPEGIETALVYAQAASPRPSWRAFGEPQPDRRRVSGRASRHRGRLDCDERRLLRSETWDKLVQVETLDDRAAERAAAGRVRHQLPACLAEARPSGMVHRRLVPPGTRRRHRRARTIKELLKKRIATQPLSLPNAGSVFRNPPGDHAARLIESCGLKASASATRRCRKSMPTSSSTGPGHGDRHRASDRARGRQRGGAHQRAADREVRIIGERQ